MKRDDLKKYFEKSYSAELNQKKLLEQEELDLFPEEEVEETEEVKETADGEEVKETEEIKIEPGDEVRLGKQFDIALDSLLADYEMKALKSAQIYQDAKEEIQLELHAQKLSSLLFEQEEQVSENELDIDLFSEDVARLIKNYDVLMDMESIIFNKAKEFLIIKYGEPVANAFSEILRVRHNMDFDSEIEELEDIEVAAPLAVGATTGAGPA